MQAGADPEQKSVAYANERTSDNADTHTAAATDPEVAITSANTFPVTHHLRNAIQTTQLQSAWISAGAKIRVRYMRVLQQEHADERHDPDVGNDLFRDWDGQKTFGLLGTDASPSYHRYMEAQVNKKYYKIIQHKFFTLQAPRSIVQMMMPTYFPLLHSWNTTNTVRTGNPSLVSGVYGNVEAVATGEIATNSISVAGANSQPTDLATVIRGTIPTIDIPDTSGTYHANPGLNDRDW